MRKLELRMDETVSEMVCKFSTAWIAWILGGNVLYTCSRA